MSYAIPAPLTKSSLAHCPSELQLVRLDDRLGIAYFAADSKSEPGKVNVVGLDIQTGESHCSCTGSEVGRDCWHRSLVQAAWDGHTARPALAVVPVPANVSVFRVIPNARRAQFTDLYGA